MAKQLWSCPGTLRGTGFPIKWNLGYPVETSANQLTQIKDIDPPILQQVLGVDLIKKIGARHGSLLANPYSKTVQWAQGPESVN